MKFSNGNRLDAAPVRHATEVTVEWQSLLLESVSDFPQEGALDAPPALDAIELVVSETPLHTNMKDDLTGVMPDGSSQFQDGDPNRYALALRGTQPSDSAALGSSLVVGSDSLSEVVKIYLQQAEAYCQENQWDKAFNACREILKVAPATAEAYKFLGKILQQKGQPTDAMGFYAKALTLRPNFPEVYSNMGSLYAKKGDWDEAIAYYRKAIDRDANFAAAYLNLAKVWKKLGQTESEINCLVRAYQLQPDLGSAKDHCQLAQSLEADGNKESAIGFYQQAVERDPNLVMAYQRLADLLEERGDWKGAAVCYRKVLALNAQAESAPSASAQRPVHPQANAPLNASSLTGASQGPSGAANASVQASSGLSAPLSSPSPASVPSTQRPLNLSAADQQRVQKLLQASSTRQLVNPPLAGGAAAGMTPAMNPPAGQSPTGMSASSPAAQAVSPAEMAQRFAAVQDWPNAIRYTQQAISQSPRSAMLHRSLATLFENTNESKLAAESWYRSFVLEPSWPSVEQCFTLGRRLSRVGNTEAATRCYRQAIQSQPDFAPAYEALAQLFRSQGDTAAAAAILQQLARQQPPAAKKKAAATERSIAQAAPSFTLSLPSDPPAVSSGREAPDAMVHDSSDAVLSETSPQFDPVPLNVSDAAVDPAEPVDPAELLMPLPSLSKSMDVKARSMAVHERGDMLKLKGDLKSALACYQEALQLLQVVDDTADVQSAVVEAQNRALELHKKGDELRKQGQWETAIEQYQAAIRLNPDFFWSHHSLGDCYKKTDDKFSAIAAYRQAIERDDKFVWSHYSMGEILEQLEQWAAAAQSYRRAQQLEPENLQIPPRLASVLKQLLHQSPRDIDLYKALGTQLTAQNKTAEAISMYQMALQIQPDDNGIALALSQLLSELDPRQAHALADRGLSKITTSQDVRTLEDLTDSKVVAELLKHTHLFDPVYYRATNPEIASLDDASLLLHYIEQGSANGCKPNPLFDDQFYSMQQPDVVMKRLNPLAHYHCFGFQSGSDPHPFFSADLYCKSHPDIAAAGINPLEHYLGFGAQEGRTAFSSAQFSHVLESDTPAAADYLEVLRAGTDPTTPQTLGVYCSSLGNYFIAEIADFIADALVQAGHRVTRFSEQDVPPDNLDGHWVVAPHEFFYLGDGPRWAQRQQWLENAVMVNVEQPQTSWFSKAFHFLRHTKVIFDINVKSAAILHALDLPAYWLPLGTLKDYAPFTAPAKLPDLLSMRSLSPQIRDHLPAIDAPLVERPLDIHFIGTLNPRREQFFAESAGWLSQYHCFMHMPHMGVPLLKGQDQALDTEAVVGISRRSQILLNVHRDPVPYFEWHRIVFHGLWQNTLVVTEPCHDIPGLVAGQHYIACPLSEMAERVEWLLRSVDGRAVAERIRRAGHEALKTQFAGDQIMGRALTQAQSAIRAKPAGVKPMDATIAGSNSLSAATSGAEVFRADAFNQTGGARR